MKLTVLAIDYDGTIAAGDGVADEVRAAIAAVREAGIVALLVTGRILDELRRVAGDLHFVDGVVAENGAIVHFPSSGHTSLLAPPVPPALLGELERRGIPYRPGQCLVDTDADESGRLEAPGPRAAARAGVQPPARDDPAAGREQGHRPAGRPRHPAPVRPQHPRRR
jgi:hypothetical protein